MSNNTETKRMNFFTGFFTTAADWEQEQQFHLSRRKLHNRRLHRPGIMPAEAEELRVEAAGNLNVRVRPGAALDGNGNEIYLAENRTLAIDPTQYQLPRLVYVTIFHHEERTDYVDNVQDPEYSGYTRWTETPQLEIITTLPDSLSRLELARIDLQPNVSEITEPEDPVSPGPNQIDRTHVLWAGSVGVTESGLSPTELEGIIQVMQDKRGDFAALAQRFPVPSVADVRHAAINLEMLARTGCLRPEQLPNALAVIALIEQDVGQEIGAAYPAVTAVSEFAAYQAAVAALLTAGLELAELLIRQAAVSEAARQLSEVVLRPPEADAGPNRTVPTAEETTTVTLDAGDSEAFGEQTIVQYRWDEI